MDAMIRHTGIGIIGVSLLMAGCGGGDSTATTSSTTTSSAITYDGPTAALNIITVEEADAVAGTIAAMETESSSLLSDATSVISLGVVDTSDSTLDMGVVGDITRGLSKRAFSSDISSSVELARLTDTATQACDPYNGATGSITVSATIAYYDQATDTWTPTSGDSFSMSFSNCYDATSMELINGSTSLVLNDVSAFDQYADNPEFSASFNFSSLTALETTTGDQTGIHGGFTASFSSDSVSGAQQFSFSGSSLIVEQVSGGVTESALLSEFSFVDTQELNLDFTFDHDYSIASTEIGGSVIVEMTTPFYIAYPDTYPSDGVVVVTFVNGSIRLTAQPDATNVFIEYDLDGNPGYETSTTTAWGSL